MNSGLTVMYFFFILLDVTVFLICGIQMMGLICNYTKESVKRSRPLFIRISGWTGYGVLAVILPSLFWNDAITMLSLLIYYLLLGWLVYHKSPVGLLYQVIYLLLMYGSQAIAIMLSYGLYTKLNISAIGYNCIVILWKDFLHICILKVIWTILKKRYASDQKNMKIWRMALIPFLSMILIWLFIVCAAPLYTEYDYSFGYVIVFCLIILVINGYCLYFWYDVSASQELKNRLEMIERQNNLTYQYYGEMEENYNKSRKIIHDIRNHMHMLEQLGKMEEAKQYFTDVHVMLNSLGLKFYCENRMLNIVLNDKCRHLKPEEWDCNLAGVGLEFLSDLDVTTIFANLLDNAMEARETESCFRLKIQGEQIQDFTVIQISNSFHGNYKKGHSGKTGHEGLGLINVRNAVEKYHGEINIEYKEDIFSVTLVFPGQ